MNRHGTPAQIPRSKALSIALAMSLGFGCQAKNNPNARYHDAGVLITDQDGAVSHEFQFNNNGKSTIIIEKINKSCGCTEATLDKLTLPPGEVATLRMSVSAANPKEETVQVTLDTDDPKEKQKRFALKYTLIPRNIVTPNKITIDEQDFNGKESCIRKVNLQTNYAPNDKGDEDGRLTIGDDLSRSCSIDQVEELPRQANGKYTTRIQEITIRVGRASLLKDYLRQYPVALSKNGSTLGILVMEIARSEEIQLTPSAINFGSMAARSRIDSEEKNFVMKLGKASPAHVELEEANGLLNLEELSRSKTDDGDTVIKYSAKLPAKSVVNLSTKGPITGYIRIKQLGDTGPKVRWACYIEDGDESLMQE